MLKEITVFPINFFEFMCDDSLTDTLLEKVKKLEYRPNHRNQVSITNSFYDKNLFDWFSTCLDEARTKIGLSNKLSFDITSCWVNRTYRMQGHHLHGHPNSIVSGIFYLTSHDSSATIFKLPNYWMKNFDHYFFSNAFPDFNARIFPKKSTLILFPSHLSHSVSSLTKNEERYTISFNTFLSGEINDGLDNRSGLHIKTKKVEDC